jgi:nucleoside-diphosphate-sugar epimerase
MSGFKVGIVGGSGYIGSVLANYLGSAFAVKIIDKNPLPRDLRPKVEYQKCDILEYNEIKQALNDVNLVIHTAIVQVPLINEKKEARL